MKTTNSTVLKYGDIHTHSIRVAYAQIPIPLLKESAQKLSESINWSGRSNHNYDCLEAMMYVIHTVDPKFETKYISVI